MRSWRFIWIVPIVVVMLDLYVFQAIKTVSQAASPRCAVDHSYRLLGDFHPGANPVAMSSFLIYRRITWLQGYPFFILIGFYLAKIWSGSFCCSTISGG